MTAMQIILIELLIWSIWMAYTDKKETAIKKRLLHFKEMAASLEIFLHESDRTNQVHADLSLDMLRTLKEKSFCKKTDRLFTDVEAFWKSLFLHLYK